MEEKPPIEDHQPSPKTVTMGEGVTAGKSLPNITIQPSEPDAKHFPERSHADLHRPTIQTSPTPNVAYLTFPASKSAPSITVQTFPVRISDESVLMSS